MGAGVLAVYLVYSDASERASVSEASVETAAQTRPCHAHYVKPSAMPTCLQIFSRPVMGTAGLRGFDGGWSGSGRGAILGSELGRSPGLRFLKDLAGHGVPLARLAR